MLLLAGRLTTIPGKLKADEAIAARLALLVGAT